MLIMQTKIVGLAALLAFALSQSASAVPTLVTAQLTGDNRPGSPDNLIVDVSIEFDGATDTTAKWVVDINSPFHPDIKLKEFVANLAASLDKGASGLSDDLTIIIDSPSASGWTVKYDENLTGLGGGAQLQFDFLVGAGTDVNNSTSLEFTTTLVNGLFWSTSAFTDAVSFGNEGNTGQMGVHLQSLAKGDGDKTDSGVALGNYQVTQHAVPEPASLAVWSMLAVGVASRIRRRTAG